MHALYMGIVCDTCIVVGDHTDNCLASEWRCPLGISIGIIEPSTQTNVVQEDGHKYARDAAEYDLYRNLLR